MPANNRSAWGWPAVHAVLFALSFPPFDLWPLAFLAVAPLVRQAATPSRMRRVALITFIGQVLLWLWLLRWIVPVTAVGYPLLAMYMSIWPTLFVLAMRLIVQNPRLSRWPLTLLVPIVWTGIEFFRGEVLFYGYPWYLLGHSLIAVLSFVQSADLFGTYFISFLCAMIAGAILDFTRASDVAVTSRRRFAVITAIALLIANITYGMWRMNQTASLSPGPRIAAVQTNLPQSNKQDWTDEQKAIDVMRFMDLTQQAIAASDPKPDAIVWPETMVPGAGFEISTIVAIAEIEAQYPVQFRRLYHWAFEVAEFQQRLNVPMIVGSITWLDVQHTVNGDIVRLNPQKIYNSAFLLNGKFERGNSFQRYDKYFLTPFGETMPYISEWKWLEQFFLRIGVGADLSFDLHSNPDIKLLQFNWNKSQPIKVATPICFEDTVGRFCRRMIYRDGMKVGDAFLNISNDGWFTFSIADRKLHAQITRFRCIENRVPMVRSVNTGFSIHTDSCGRIVGAAGGNGYGRANTDGWVIADIVLDSRTTLYGRIGELWPMTCLIATGMLAAVGFVQRSRNVRD